MWDESLVLATRSFRSRLVLGTDGYPSTEIMRRSHDASATELVALAVRGLDLAGAGRTVIESIDQGRVTVLAMTSGAQTAEEATLLAYLAREAGLAELIGVDIVGDSRTDMSDLAAIVEATKTLTRDGFAVLAVTGCDPVVARRLAEAGAAAVLVRASAPGSGLGLRDPLAVRLVLDAVSVPVLAAGGIGTASDAALAMEIGCHGVFAGTAVAQARDPEGMAEAMRHAVEAGRYAHKAGRMSRRLHRHTYGTGE